MTTVQEHVEATPGKADSRGKLPEAGASGVHSQSSKGAGRLQSGRVGRHPEPREPKGVCFQGPSCRVKS